MKRRGTLFCAFPLFWRVFGEVAEHQLRSCWLTVEPRVSQLLTSINKEANQEYFRLVLAVFLESALCNVTKCNHTFFSIPLYLATHVKTGTNKTPFKMTNNKHLY